MQTQKFDPSKPHAMVYGHPDALYEQDGILYGGDNNPVEDNEGRRGDAPKASKKASAPKVKADEEKSPVALFLSELLEGGPLLQNNVKKEAEKAGLEWSDVLSTAAEMSIQKYKSGIANMWKLKGDE